MAINYVIQFKRQDSAMWASVNPILRRAEPGYESDTGRFKIGNGLLPWNSLPYASLDHEEDGVVLTTDENVITANMIVENAGIDVSKLSGVVSQDSGTVVNAPHGSSVVRNIKASTSSPSGGNDGDVWLVYIP